VFRTSTLHNEACTQSAAAGRKNVLIPGLEGLGWQGTHAGSCLAAHSHQEAPFDHRHKSPVLSFGFQSHFPPENCFVVDTGELSLSSPPRQNHIISATSFHFGDHMPREAGTMLPETAYEI